MALASYLSQKETLCKLRTVCSRTSCRGFGTREFSQHHTCQSPWYMTHVVEGIGAAQGSLIPAPLEVKMPPSDWHCGIARGGTHTVQMPVLCLQCRVINTTWKSKDSSLEHHHWRSEIFQKPIIFCVNIMVCPSGAWGLSAESETSHLNEPWCLRRK